MRITFVLPGIHRVNRGAEVAFESVAAELARLGTDDVTVVGSGPPIPGRPYTYRRHRLVSRDRFLHAPKLALLRSDSSYEEATFAVGFLAGYRSDANDVTVTCSYPYMNLVLTRWPLRKRPPHVFVTQNGDWPAYSNDGEFRFFRCDALVCTNPEYYLRNRHRWNARLIPNGFDPDLIHPGHSSRADLGLPPDRSVVLIVSALIDSKRVLQGLRAVAKVPDVFLVVAGDGELRSEVDALGNELMPGRFRRMRLAPSEMGDLYRAADVVFHPSLYESFGNVYVEALATGVPVVAHDYAVTRWIFGDHPGLVDVSDETVLLDALRLALSGGKEDALRRAAGAAERFSWRAVAEQYRAFLAEVVEGNGVITP